jgi:hypothetical protein
MKYSSTMNRRCFAPASVLRSAVVSAPWIRNGAAASATLRVWFFPRLRLRTPSAERELIGSFA